MMVYWLYNITADQQLLKLADLLHQQTFDFTNAFQKTSMLSTLASIHCVNLAQGMKEPMIYDQQHPEQKYLDAIDKGFKDLRKYNGMAHACLEEMRHYTEITQRKVQNYVAQ